MSKRKKKDYEIISDRRTVWINKTDGSNIARFSATGGIDVHNSVTDQLAGAPQCLYCTKGPATLQDWETFKQKVMEHFNIEVADTHKPKGLEGDLPPLPRKGDVIYVPARWFIDRGEDDTEGGKATVTKTETKFNTRFVDVKELPRVGFNWDILVDQQEKLKKQYGDSWAHPDPDYGGSND